MIASVAQLLKKIDDLRSAAAAARALGEHFDDQERRGILQLADEWDSRAAEEEERVAELSTGAERS